MNSCDQKPFSFSGRVRSFRYALRGIVGMIATQHNTWVHGAVMMAVIAAGILCALSAGEWCIIVLTVAAVWTAEALNTALEYLCDAVSPQLNPLVEKAKDVAAGAVLMSALGAVLVGMLIFGPRLLALAA